MPQNNFIDILNYFVANNLSERTFHMSIKEVIDNCDLSLNCEFVKVVAPPPQRVSKAIMYFPNEDPQVRLLGETEVASLLEERINLFNEMANAGDRHKQDYFTREVASLHSALKSVQETKPFSEAKHHECYRGDNHDVFIYIHD